VPPPGEPPVDDTGKDLRARKAEQDDGPPPPIQPGKDFGRGLFPREHRSVGQDQVHRLQAGAFRYLRKSPGEILGMTGEKFERIRRGISPDPVDRDAAYRAISVVDEDGSCHRQIPTGVPPGASYLQREAKKSSPSQARLSARISERMSNSALNSNTT
jgi:hypothetical protein